jgi:hypothetical protein
MFIYTHTQTHTLALIKTCKYLNPYNLILTDSEAFSQ